LKSFEGFGTTIKAFLTVEPFVQADAEGEPLVSFFWDGIVLVGVY
jgi:hypothetical protein